MKLPVGSESSTQTSTYHEWPSGTRRYTNRQTLMTQLRRLVESSQVQVGRNICAAVGPEMQLDEEMWPTGL